MSNNDSIFISNSSENRKDTGPRHRVGSILQMISHAGGRNYVKDWSKERRDGGLLLLKSTKPKDGNKVNIVGEYLQV